MPVTGEDSHKAEKFDLPVIDVQKARRNFEGYREKKYYSLADLKNNEWKFHTGTTDTDEATDPNDNEKGYAGIYQKKGLPKPRPSKMDSPLEKADLKAKTMKENWSAL
jgi:hypothetical protein